MATVICPKCSAKVNTDLQACPKCGLSRLAESKQNFSKKIATIILIPFNVFLAVWLFSSLHIVSSRFGGEEAMLTQPSNALSPLSILAIWIIGDAFLLGYLWLKRAKKQA